jgi:hypothetical protein
LTATDVASGWICLYSPLNKAHCRTFDALKNIYAGLPFQLREFHQQQSCCAITAANSSTMPLQTGIVTRSAPSPSRARETARKTTTVSLNRKTAPSSANIGYDRLEGNVLQERLAGVYKNLVPLLNFFMPATKLESKIKTVSK